MNWKALLPVFSLGYGINEFSRDYHAVVGIMLGWLVVDVQPLISGTLDGPTFVAHAKFAAGIAVTMVLKSLVTDASPPK